MDVHSTRSLARQERDDGNVSVNPGGIMALGWRTFLFCFVPLSFGAWFLVAYIRYISAYCSARGLPPRAKWDLLLVSSVKVLQILSEHQSEPQLDRLRRRALVIGILIPVSGMSMFAFVAFGGPG